MTNLHNGSDGYYRPAGLPLPVTPHGIALQALERLAEINRDKAALGETQVHAMDPRDLAAKVRVLSETLQWSVQLDGRLSSDRAVEVIAWLVGLVLARARVEELDVSSGDAA